MDMQRRHSYIHDGERAVVPPLSCDKLNRSQILLLAQSLLCSQLLCMLLLMPGVNIFVNIFVNILMNLFSF